jgi:hypothetical protein
MELGTHRTEISTNENVIPYSNEILARKWKNILPHAASPVGTDDLETSAN